MADKLQAAQGDLSSTSASPAADTVSFDEAMNVKAGTFATSEGGTVEQYSEQLDHIGQAVVVGDILMLVLVVMAFLKAGLSFGNAVTRWLKSDG